LFVLPWETHKVGGVTNVVNNLAQVMTAHGSLLPKIAVNRPNAEQPQDAQATFFFAFSLLAAATPIGLLKACIKAPIQLARTLRMLRSQHVQVVNFHYPGLAPLGVAILKSLGLYQGKLLLSYHGTDVAPPRGNIDRMARRLIHSAADRLVACSNSLAVRMISDLNIPASRVAVIFNGVDKSVFEGRTDVATPPRLRVPDWFILNVGSFIPRKNHVLLFEAFALLAPRYPALQLCIAGADGDERPALEAAIAERGLRSRVQIFVGLDPRDVAHLLARAVVCVQPSLAESFPLAVLEAGASGTPLVVSDIPGHDEMIQQETTGLLFPLGDAAACAAAIASVLDDPIGATKRASAQRDRVRREFTLLSCLQNYEQLAGVR
jgi:phosphatidylinositol alpha-1,6-mannosyltransferase